MLRKASLERKLYRYKQRKDRQHSDWDADGQNTMIRFQGKQRGGCRDCYFHCRQGWI